MYVALIRDIFKSGCSVVVLLERIQKNVWNDYSEDMFCGPVS